jgi:hypothetical protein
MGHPEAFFKEAFFKESRVKFVTPPSFTENPGDGAPGIFWRSEPRYFLVLISLAGTPPQIACGGTSWVATPMAPSIESSPVLTPAITAE